MAGRRPTQALGLKNIHYYQHCIKLCIGHSNSWKNFVEQWEGSQGEGRRMTSRKMKVLLLEPYTSKRYNFFWNTVLLEFFNQEFANTAWTVQIEDFLLDGRVLREWSSIHSRRRICIFLIPQREFLCGYHSSITQDVEGLKTDHEGLFW